MITLKAIREEKNKCFSSRSFSCFSLLLHFFSSFILLYFITIKNNWWDIYTQMFIITDGWIISAFFLFPKCCKEYVATKQQCANNINRRERERVRRKEKHDYQNAFFLHSVLVDMRGNVFWKYLYMSWLSSFFIFDAQFIQINLMVE